MPTVKLELEKLQILRPKERWQLYFIVATEHPTDNTKMVLSSMPDPYIRLKPNENNLINFEPVGAGTDGFTVFERDMPADKKLSVRMYLRHSRQDTRDLGKILQDIKGELGVDAFGLISNVLGTTAPWLEISKNAVPLLGGILKRIKDRDFGFVNMDEEFGPEFENQVELDRENNFSTGDAKIVWSWSIR